MSIDVHARCRRGQEGNRGVTLWTVYANDTPLYGGECWDRSASDIRSSTRRAARDYWRHSHTSEPHAPEEPRPMPDDAVTVENLPREAETLARCLYLANAPVWRRLVNTYSKRGRLTESQADEAARQEPWCKTVLEDARFLGVPLTADSLEAFADESFNAPKYAAGLTPDDAETVKAAEPYDQDRFAIPFAGGELRGDRYGFVKAAPLPGAETPPLYRVNDIPLWDANATERLVPACIIKDNTLVFTNGKQANIRVMALVAKAYPTATWYCDPSPQVAPIVARIGKKWVGMVMPLYPAPTARQKMLLEWRTEGNEAWPY
jgi:hypothetical protein